MEDFDVFDGLAAEKRAEIGVCDYDGEETEVKRLDIGGGSSFFLCQKHWQEEMEWRKERNLELAPEAQFEIIPWENA